MNWRNKMTSFPTKEHEIACNKFVEIFRQDKRIKSILVNCSCARGKATKDSCLDLVLIIKEDKYYNLIENKFKRLKKSVKEFIDLKKVGKYSHIDLQITTGKIIPKPRDWTSGPDEYELEIGNIFRYSKLLFDKKGYFKKLSKKYLPYYSEKVRKKKLVGVLGYMNNNLDHIEIYVKRGLYFHAFSRFYSALREFLQALFISKKIYPIAYDKHIKEQFYDILKMPKFNKN